MPLIHTFFLFFTQKPKSMKRSFVFLGMCLALAAGLTTAQKAKSSAKAAASFCCNDNETRCKWSRETGWSTGPIAASLPDCVEF